MLKNIEYEKMRKDLNKKDKEIGLLQEELEQRDKEIDQLLNMIVYLERETIKI
jgi:peptidoglycan hydrolase CwlO-like protein